MISRITLMAACVLAIGLSLASREAAAQYPSGDARSYGMGCGRLDGNRFYHYPYVFYPHNYLGNDYYRSADSLYFRYPPEMRIPVYNKQWHNELPQARRYHWGHHFMLDYF